MRNAILVITLVLTFVTGQSQERPSKPPPADVDPGRIAWFDITTSDLPKSKEFYSKLFDWKFTPLQGTDLAVEIVANGVAIGTLRGAEGKISAFNGVVYVQVNDLQASCNKSKELGGTVVPGFPFNLSDRPGAIALILDPAGASDRYVFQNASCVTSSQVTIPARSGKPVTVGPGVGHLLEPDIN